MPNSKNFIKDEIKESKKPKKNSKSEQQLDEKKDITVDLDSKEPQKRKGKKPVFRDEKSNLNIIVDRFKPETKSYILSRVPHLALPNFNFNLKGTRLNRIAEQQLFRCNEPEVISVSLEQLTKIDACHKRTLAHSEYNSSLTKQKSCFAVDEKKKKLRKVFKKNIYPLKLITYAELLENNPDPYFNGRYDWYFTGGNLFCDNDNNILVHAGGNNLQELVISKFKKRSGKNFLGEISRIDHSKELKNNYDVTDKFPEILEVQKLKSLKNRYLIRQKNSVSLYTLDEENLESDIVIPNSAGSAPYITAASHLYQPDIILTGDLNRTVHLWNLKQSNTIPNKILLQLSSDENNWNQLKNFDQNTFAFATSRRLYLLDIRLTPEEMNKNYFDFKDKLNECECITSMQISDISNCIYLGGTHKMFSVDPRCILNDSINDTDFFLQLWTHQMKLPPLMLKSFNLVENYDIIVASSPLSGDLRLFENTRKLRNDVESFSSCSLPYMPPSLADAYHNIQKSGECLDPTTNLEKRIKRCICGLDFFHRGSKFYVAFSNSLGDIFTQQLIFDDEEPASKNGQSIKMYNDRIKMNLIDNPQVLNATDVKDLSGINKVLRCSRLNNQNEGENTIFNEINEIKPQLKRSKWQRSKKQLSKYKDVLAQDLLTIWDIDESDEEVTNAKSQLKKIKHENKLEVPVKVGNWLDNITFDDCDTKSFDLDFTTNNIFSSTQYPRSTFEQDNTLQNSIDLESTNFNFSTIIHNKLSPLKTRLSEEEANCYNDLSNIEERFTLKIAQPKKPKKPHVIGF